MAGSTDGKIEGVRSEQSDVADAAEEAGDRFEAVGRAGWVAKGLVYSLVGVLFIGIAFDGGGEAEANQAGAIEEIASKPFGTVLLAALSVGLFLYSIWRIATVVMPGDWTGRALLDRGGYAVSAAVYASLLVTTVGFVIGSTSEAGDREDRLAERVVNEVMAVPAGRWLVAFAGLLFLVVAAVFARKGITRSFREDMTFQGGIEGTAIDHLGLVGWVARAVSMALVGIFLIRAAWLFEPEEAAGLDDSVRQISSNPAGAVLAGVVGLGFLAYGVFAVLSARHRILEGPTNE